MTHHDTEALRELTAKWRALAPQQSLGWRLGVSACIDDIDALIATLPAEAGSAGAVDLPFSPYLVSEWTGPDMTDRRTWTAYTAEQMRKYASDATTRQQAEIGALRERCEAVERESARKSEDYAGLSSAWRARTEQAESERDALRQRVEAAEADARRYLWLRNGGSPAIDVQGPGSTSLDGPELDAAIDAALAGSAATGEAK